MSSVDQTQARRIGRNVFIGLAVATVVEFVVAVGQVPGLIGLIMALAIVKAWLIVVYFMHVGRLRGGAD